MTKGSWFIQELCEVLRAAQRQLNAGHGVEYNIADLMTVVARKVAVLYESDTGQSGSSQMKQMVSCLSSLTRLAYLTKLPCAPPTAI